MTKLTTERLEELANATTPSVKYVGREIIAIARQLLAYEQAAPAQPVALIFENHAYTELYKLEEIEIAQRMQKEVGGTINELFKGMPARSVIPKHSEHSRHHFESLCNQFWNWAEFDEINQDEEPRLEWDGSNYTNRVTAALWKMYQAAPAQPEPLMGTVVSIDDASGLEGHRQWGEVVGLSESRGKPVICVEVTGYQYD